MGVMVWYWTESWVNGLVLGLRVGLMVWYWIENGANGLVLD